MPILSAVLAGLCLLQTPVWPQTRAERTKFLETSHYEDVISFLQDLQKAGAPMTIKWMGDSTEGKKMPLVIASRPLVTTPTEAKATGKPIIYIQANIHAGEVEGKEAALALLRDYCKQDKGILDKVILLVVPIYNIDGNEKFGPQAQNRPGQEGPELVGVRPNGQGLDLNRDCMKVESPEMRAVLQNVYSWNPDVVFDLHTTDGTRHGYQMTYSPGLHPNMDPEVRKFTQDELLPKIRREVAKKKLRMFDYGNLAKREGKPVWETFGYEGRYVSNYAGLRNRISILSEAMVNCPFDVRVWATETFVDATLQELAKQAKRVVEMTREADEKVVAWGTDAKKVRELGVRFEMASRGKEGVLLEKASAARRTGPITEWESINMPVYDRFKATKTSPFPMAYLIPSDADKVVELLRRHGIRVEQVTQDFEGPVSWFRIDNALVAGGPFQGHKLVRLDGKFDGAPAKISRGTYLVRTAQPLGLLVFELLEPQSMDGVVAWGFYGEDWPNGKEYPVVKIMTPLKVATVVVP